MSWELYGNPSSWFRLQLCKDASVESPNGGLYARIENDPRILRDVRGVLCFVVSPIVNFDSCSCKLYGEAKLTLPLWVGDPTRVTSLRMLHSADDGATWEPFDKEPTIHKDQKHATATISSFSYKVFVVTLQIEAGRSWSARTKFKHDEGRHYCVLHVYVGEAPVDVTLLISETILPRFLYAGDNSVIQKLEPEQRYVHWRIELDRSTGPAHPCLCYSGFWLCEHTMETYLAVRCGTEEEDFVPVRYVIGTGSVLDTGKTWWACFLAFLSGAAASGVAIVVIVAESKITGAIIAVCATLLFLGAMAACLKFYSTHRIWKVEEAPGEGQMQANYNFVTCRYS